MSIGDVGNNNKMKVVDGGISRHNAFNSLLHAQAKSKHTDLAHECWNEPDEGIKPSA